MLLCVVINKDNINVRKRRGGPTPSLEPEEDPNRKRRDVHLTYKKRLFMGKTVSCYLTKIPTCKEFQDAKSGGGMEASARSPCGARVFFFGSR